VAGSFSVVGERMLGARRLTNRQVAMALGKVIGMDIFSLEYGILSFLHEVRRASQKEILFSISCSPATLQRKLGFLGARGLIGAAIDVSDKRRRVFTLMDPVRRILDEELAHFADWRPNGKNSTDGLSALVDRLEKRLNIDIFGSEYKISVTIYFNNGITNLSLLEKSGIPRGSFYSVLKKLKNSEIIYYNIDKIDKRIKRYYINSEIEEKIDDYHEILSNWSSEIFRN